MCIAINGYHSVASYEWSKDGFKLLDEVHPLLYASSTGKFTCSVTIKTKVIERYFEVKGMYVNSL